MAVTDLITWVKVKSLLSLQDEDQEITEFIINSVSLQAQRMMGRSIVPVSSDMVMHGTGLQSLLLEEYPVKSVTALYIDTSFQFAPDTQLDISEYYVDKKIGQIELFWRHFPRKEYGRSVKVVYEAGFDETPADLQQAVLESVQWNYNRIQFDGVGVKNEKVDGVSQSFEVTIPTNAREIFQSYRRPNV